MIALRHERMNDVFEKWHVIGLPIPIALHHFTGVDHGDWHDHPWAFSSRVLSGGYVEEVLDRGLDGSWRVETAERGPGASHWVPASHIHRIVDLPEGECWTLVMAGSCEREARFYRLDGERVVSRAWHEREFA